MTETTELTLCQVRSSTDRPCRRPAVVKIRGIPFCEPCAREQEVYFAIGELTETSGRLGDEPLVRILDRARRIGRQSEVVRGDEPEAAQAVLTQGP